MIINILKSCVFEFAKNSILPELGTKYNEIVP